MIYVRHEGPGPYVERTIVEWNTTINTACADMIGDVLDRVFEKGPENATDPAELDSANERAEEAEGRASRLDMELADAKEKIDGLEDLLEEEDPRSALRERAETWRKEALRLGIEVKRLRDENRTLSMQLRNARARTCTVCSKWSAHDDRGYCTAHGKPIKGLALKRRRSAA